MYLAGEEEVPPFKSHQARHHPLGTEHWPSLHHWTPGDRFWMPLMKKRTLGRARVWLPIPSSVPSLAGNS